jgi:hypothetical protein
MLSVIVLSAAYAECHCAECCLCQVSFMLSVVMMIVV